MSSMRPMKDGLNQAAVIRMASAFEAAQPSFRRDRFIAAAMDGLDRLELKPRVHHLIHVLHQLLPADFVAAADILSAVRNHWDPGDPDDNLRGFAAWPVIDYIGVYGLDSPERSLEVLAHLTPLFSAEFAIRPFIQEHTALTLRTMEAWCASNDEHLRRLASEGCRPRLPWGRQLPDFVRNPAPILPILEQLKDDPSDYVRRSVANNLNDIAKDHPEKVLSICRQWKQGAGPQREWIIRHATRTLVKTGQPGVYALLGYTEQPKLTVQSLTVAPKAIAIGDSIEFTARIQSKADRRQSFVVDYAVHHMRANGKTSPKVFKLKSVKLSAGKTVEIRKLHTLAPVTTRRYYPGEHFIELLINGAAAGRSSFHLDV